MYKFQRRFSSKVFVSNLPTYWDKNEISSRFSSIGQINKVNLIKNSLGRNSGKAIIEYGSEKHAAQAIEHFDNRAVNNLVCNARPFLAKNETSSRNEANLLSRRVYLMNIPYDTHVKEVENLCKEFVSIDKIVLPRDPSGLARGYAFVYVKDEKEVQTLIDYVDGRHIRSRQVRAKGSLGDPKGLTKKQL